MSQKAETGIKNKPEIAVDDPEALVGTSREWLVTNGLGGYASGTVSGLLTRRYHGLLIAAFPDPLGRTMMLNGLAEVLCVKNDTIFIAGTSELVGEEVTGIVSEVEFRLEDGLPIWRYSFADCVLEKHISMTHGRNETRVSYRYLSGTGSLTLHLRPGVNFRSHDAPVESTAAVHVRADLSQQRLELSASGFPRLCLECEGATFVHNPIPVANVLYRTEESRGYESRGSLWSPGYFEAGLCPSQSIDLVAYSETKTSDQVRETVKSEQDRRAILLQQAPEALRSYPASQLVLAADQFLIQKQERQQTIHAPQATVIAGYHWFTDWGRDTMISLEGLTLVTGRFAEARAILLHFGEFVRDGLIPNMFPEGHTNGLYHTADATLWFFHAISRYFTYTGDKKILYSLLPTLMTIIQKHIDGTRFNIYVDPTDQLLVQGQEGYQLTWMDAKVGDWVVTPRRGKAVEINALWYNVLMTTAEWLEESGSLAAGPLRERAAQVRTSFNKRFWMEKAGYLFDVIDGPDGNDISCRPNQLLSFSLPHPVLEECHRQIVLDVVTDRLLTPVGLRSLDPQDPKYCAKYFGNLWSRDAAYHQGTVWGWLIGPYIDAWLRVHPEDTRTARRFLEGFVPHLQEAGVGSISEIFDAEQPHTPRGCIAQAWSVAEVLRCWHLTA